MEQRMVWVYQWDNQHRPGTKKIRVGTGVFHQFGVDYEEFETGPGQFTTAVVEMPDGTVKGLPLDLISFMIE